MLVERHTPFVRRYLRVLGAQPGQELDDLQQDAFLAMLQGSFVDRGDAPTRALLRRGARLAFSKRHRGRLPGPMRWFPCLPSARCRESRSCA
ncbi:MAG: sigma factor [Planctomycetota bacterium]